MAWLINLLLLTVATTSAMGQPAELRHLPDPMRPPALQPMASASQPAGNGTVTAPSVKPLQALRLQAARPQALVQGQWVRVGDTVLGAKVMSIDERGVRLRRDSTIELLQLLPSAQLTPGLTPTAKP